MDGLNELHNPTLRVVRILDVISSHNGELTMSEISRLTDIPRGTIVPILKTLCASKYISMDRSFQKYSIDVRLFLSGASFAASETSSYNGLQAVIQKVSEESGETVHMGTLDAGNVLYVAKHESSQAVRVSSTAIGKELPAYGTALGKALLCEYTLPQLVDLYPEGLKPITRNTITNMNVLLRQLEEVRNTGFAYESEESSYGVRCIAKPLYLNGAVVASISFSIPLFRYTEEWRHQLETILTETAAVIGQILPYMNL